VSQFAQAAKDSQIIFLPLVLILSLMSLQAQVASGTISVNVTDSTEASIPDASVTVTNRDTSLTRTGSTDLRGAVRFPALPVGTYSVSVESTGFKQLTIGSVVLQVNQTAVLPVTLEVGQISEVVEVTSVTPLLETETSDLGQVIENQKIVDLPLNGRNPFALGLLAGNTMPVYGMGTNQVFVGGGGRFSANDILLDGADNNTIVTNNSIGRSGIAITPSVDAVGEFKVMTNSFSAEFGRSAGSVVSATIKSGSNEFHGSAFEFFRNDKLDANNFISNAAGAERGKFRQNQYGGSLGGPVIRDKTFFFVSYQATRQRTAAGSIIRSVPTAAIRAGNLSALGTPIFNPFDRMIGPEGAVISTLLPNAQIPESHMDSASVETAKLIPLPNFGAPGALARNYFTAVPAQEDTDQVDIRGDQQLGANNSLFVRWSIQNQDEPQGGPYPGFIGNPTTRANRSRQGVISDTHLFSPTMVHELRFAYSRNESGNVPEFLDEGLQFAQQNGIALFPFPQPAFPSLNFRQTTSSGGNVGAEEFNSWGGGAASNNIENRFQLANSLSIVKNSHNIKMGADVRRLRYDYLRGGAGTVVFGSVYTSSSNTPGSGSPFADYLYGFPVQREGAQMLDWGRQRDLYAGGFVQDDWKVSSRLTLNIGLRYELFTQPVDARDLGSLFDIETLTFALPGQNGYSRAIVDGDHNNWAPRVGFAYTWTNKWVVRGGYGFFYGNRDQNQQITAFGENNPNTPAVISPNITADGTVAPPITIGTPIEVSASPASLDGFTPQNPLSRTVRSQGFHDARFPMVQQANLSIQFQPLDTWLIAASYSGTFGRDLATNFINQNQVPWEYAMDGRNKQEFRPVNRINGVVLPIFSTGKNYYHAFNLRLEKRFSHGLSFLANYSIQKNIETLGSGPCSYTQAGTSIALDTYNLQRERTVSPIDVPRIFVISGGYELPSPNPNNKVLNAIAGGWQLNGIFNARGGFPTDIRTNLLPPVFNTFNMPDRVLDQPLLVDNAGPDQYFNPAAFRNPGTVLSNAGVPLQTFGNFGRRVARGPGSVNLDFSVFKDIAVTERYRLQFRTEAFNLTNTPTFNLPSPTNQTLTCRGAPGSACNSTNSQFGKLSGAQSVGRQIQFGLKFLF
jgi:hypothetical protein